MQPVESYLKHLHEIRSTGGAVPETSYYPALSNLLDEVGRLLEPHVRCVSQVINTGAGSPDFGLYTTVQFQMPKDTEPLPGQLPERGVVEVKAVSDDSWVTAGGKQVSKYWGRYGQVLVTNYRDFVLIGQDENSNPVKLETFRIADDKKSFWDKCVHHKKTAGEIGERLVEYLRRVMMSAVRLKAPEDVAWFLASYAREARGRIEAVANLPGLTALRAALENSLGLQFEGKEGEHFFRATLVQTLFYGVFSAWVLWARGQGQKEGRFDWRTAAWGLHVPMIGSLFEQIATPHKLKPLGLDELLDWTGGVLNRVETGSFFNIFEQEHAVQYFYEPFLKAYDPELRKQLGVWYTPREIVKYQVARVDRVLREELKLAEGLADPSVYVLDPCCGTGAYLVETLKKASEILKAKGGALVAQKLKKMATERVFGFELLPAPFVVSHLQLGLLLSASGAPLQVPSVRQFI
ncbi:MAG TPA: N-6 DNA methylase [Bryobacteraceae bacterium]|nr:N-6 DNA methylase [Bryobacteraceae bacterium]